MEEKEKSEKEKRPRVKRRVSLFRRRRKPDIRPFVRAKKQRHYKKLIIRLIFVILTLFVLIVILYCIKTFLIPQFFYKNTQILSPEGSSVMDNSQIKNTIQSAGLDVSSVIFATNSAEVTFLIHDKTSVYFSAEKDIKNQLDLVQAIDRQLTADGKQAIVIDLRYNKPIVRF